MVGLEGGCKGFPQFPQIPQNFCGKGGICGKLIIVKFYNKTKG